MNLLTKIGIGIGTVVIGFLIFLIFFTVRVPEGQVAVIYKPNGGVSKTHTAGWHFIAPLDSSTLYPVREKVVKTKATVTTKDGKTVTLPITYKYLTDGNAVIDIFKRLGSQNIETIEDNYLQQLMFKSVRGVVSNYTVLEVYGSEITEVNSKITEAFLGSLEGTGFVGLELTVGSPSIDEETEKSIAARVKASQENELKKTELENDKIEADRKRVQAQGEADAMKIKAKAEAESNEILSKSLTEQILKLEEIEARKAHGWKTHIFGESPTPVTEAGK